MSSRMCRGNKISLTLFGASSPDYHPCIGVGRYLRYDQVCRQAIYYGQQTCSL